MCRVSVIVTVYQAERYIGNCLSCLLQQNIDDYEIVCVDDGSEDHSAEMIRQFQKDNSRIRYYYQENRGVSAARNLGIQKAKGSYLMFVDSDDRIAPDSLKYLIGRAEKTKTDVLVFGGKMDDPLHAPEWMRRAFYTGRKTCERADLDAVLKQNGAYPSVCNKLFLRDTVTGIYFDEEIAVAEDLVFLIAVYQKAEKVEFYRRKIYWYRISNQESAMHYAWKNAGYIFDNHLRAAERIVREWEDGKPCDTVKQIVWDLLEMPYRDLGKDMQEKKEYKERLEFVLRELGFGEEGIRSFFDTSRTIPIPGTKEKIRSVFTDIYRFGPMRGMENIIYRLVARRLRKHGSR